MVSAWSRSCRLHGVLVLVKTMTDEELQAIRARSEASKAFVLEALAHALHYTERSFRGRRDERLRGGHGTSGNHTMAIRCRANFETSEGSAGKLVVWRVAKPTTFDMLIVQYPAVRILSVAGLPFPHETSGYVH